jgi:hypothetical protein
MPAPPLISIIQGLLHPPIDLLHMEAIAGGPHAGAFSPLRVRGFRNVDAHGVYWNVATYPAGYGLTVDNVGNHFDRPIIAFREFETLVDLNLASSPIFESREAQGVYLLYGEVPSALNIQIAPGVTVNLSWLVLF